MEKSTEVRLYIAIAILTIASIILGIGYGTKTTSKAQIKPQNDFIMIHGNRYHKDSIVEFTRYFDDNNKEYSFVVVESHIGKICFEFFPEDGVCLDEWELSFLMCFEGIQDDVFN